MERSIDDFDEESAEDGIEGRRSAIPLVVPEMEYDAELERVLAAAAWIGIKAEKSTPISFTTMLLAFMGGGDAVSRWLQEFVLKEGVPWKEIAAEAHATLESIHIAFDVKDEDQEALETIRHLFSSTADAILTRAAEVVRQVFDGVSARQIGCRHVLAAYAIRSTPDHLNRLRTWKLSRERLLSGLAGFLSHAFPHERWERLDSSLGGDTLTAGTAPGMLKTSASESNSSSPQPPAARAASTPGIPETPPSGPLVGRYTADDPYSTADDLIGIDNEAAAFARLVAARNIQPPLAIGVFGEWGAGKTYFMRRVQTHIERLAPGNRASGPPGLFLDHIVPIRFNAWHYIETNLWASLVEYIFSALDSWIQHHSGSDTSPADRVFNSLATAQQLQIDALEDVVTRRAEQQNAQARARRAREEYAAAMGRSQKLGPQLYLRALVETFLEENAGNKAELHKISTELGLPELDRASETLTDALVATRGEAGRGRLILHSITAKLGAAGSIATLFFILVGIPWATGLLAELATRGQLWWGMKSLHDTVVTCAMVIAALGVFVQRLRSSASKALDKLAKLDQRLRAGLDEQLKGTQRSQAVKNAIETERELQQHKHALDSAEQALTEAEARLSAARRDFETGTARGRMNAFIRAKVVDGSYAKHLGIIASIRKDFVQLASLVGDAHPDGKGSGEETRERTKLRQEVRLRVRGFLNWLKDAGDVRLTESELHSLLVLLDPADTPQTLAEFREVLLRHFEGTESRLDQIQKDLESSSSAPLPRFARIVLYIDDLDRCPPDKVVDVLQAVHLLLCFPLFVVFVAVDARWVSRALHERFPGLLVDPPDARNGVRQKSSRTEVPFSGAGSHDYLEKIFQIPYWVRPMERSVVSSYVRRIAAGDRRVVPIDARTAWAPGSGLGDPVLGSGSEGIPDFAGAEDRAGLRDSENAGGSADARDTHGQGGSRPIGQNVEISGGTRTQGSTLENRGGSQTDTEAAQREASQAEAVGMTLTGAEITLLETFAVYAGRTPRQAIRFVNIYRVIKSSLTPKLRAELDLEHGGTMKGLGLIPQLAIVTGAPRAAAAYFERLLSSDDSRNLTDFLKDLERDAGFTAIPESAVVRAVLKTLVEIDLKRPDFTVVTVGDLGSIAARVRRYSFGVRGEKG